MPDSDPAASADKKPMTTRRFHRKSRNGCVECKARRVKCDEAFPTCANCMRSRSTCIYTIAKDASHPRSPTTQPVPDFAAPVGPAAATFDLLDLTLMHHYSTVTAVRLFPGEYSRQIWQNILPLQARTHPLLMHGLLSLASMDLARSPSSVAADPTISRPSPSPTEQDDYRTRALHHQTMGIRIFKAQLAKTPAENADILFLFSIILVILAFAFPQTCNAPPTVDGILNLFNLLRGSKVVWKQDDTKVRSSPSATWFQHRDESKNIIPLELTPAILSRFNILRLQAMDPADSVAIDQLFTCIQEFAANPGDFSTIGRWPTVVYEDFWERLKAHQTIPLFILAHFCIVLGGFQKEWWTSNWDRMLLNAVELALSEDDKQRVGWNIEAMLDLAQFAQ